MTQFHQLSVFTKRNSTQTSRNIKMTTALAEEIIRRKTISVMYSGILT